jgi:hypothetical protein
MRVLSWGTPQSKVNQNAVIDQFQQQAMEVKGSALIYCRIGCLTQGGA